MRIHSTVVPEEIVSPDFFQQLISGKSQSLIFHQIEQQVVFLWRHGRTHAVHIHLPSGKVDLQPAEFQPLLGIAAALLCRMAPCQNCTHPCHEFSGRKGLYHIVVNAGFKTEQLVVFLAAGGQHDNGNIFLLPDLLAGGIAVQTGHHHVHDNDVIIIFPTECHRLHAVPCFGHFELLELCVLPHYGTNFFFIVYDQHFAHGFHLPRKV